MRSTRRPRGCRAPHTSQVTAVVDELLPNVEATRCFAGEGPLTLGFGSRSFSSLSVMLRPHVPSMCPARLWPQSPRAPRCGGPSGTPGLNAAGYLPPMMLKTRTTTTMSTTTPPTMTIRVPSALKRMLAGHPQALRSRQPSGCDCLSATRWLRRRFYRPPTRAL